MKKIVIYIGHPADYHLFKNIAKELIAKGWDVFVLTRNKDITLHLLEKANFLITTLEMLQGH